MPAELICFAMALFAASLAFVLTRALFEAFDAFRQRYGRQ